MSDRQARLKEIREALEVCYQYRGHLWALTETMSSMGDYILQFGPVRPENPETAQIMCRVLHAALVVTGHLMTEAKETE